MVVCFTVFVRLWTKIVATLTKVAVAISLFVLAYVVMKEIEKAQGGPIDLQMLYHLMSHCNLTALAAYAKIVGAHAYKVFAQLSGMHVVIQSLLRQWAPPDAPA